jgi:large subunit ribosomal protein L31
MKADLHPDYSVIKVACSCGNSFETKSTFSGDELHVEVCSACHPFYTGQQKLMDTAGRVDQFRKRFRR